MQHSVIRRLRFVSSAALLTLVSAGCTVSLSPVDLPQIGPRNDLLPAVRDAAQSQPQVVVQATPQTNVGQQAASRALVEMAYALADVIEVVATSVRIVDEATTQHIRRD